MVRKIVPLLKPLALAAIFAGTGVPPPEAAAQHVACASHSEVTNWLRQTFNEQPIGLGLIGDHTAVEIYVSPTGTWTIIATDLKGRACMIASGNSWISVDPPKPDVPATDSRLGV